MAKAMPPRHSLSDHGPLMPRRRAPEWMDDPGLDPQRHREALRGLEHINRASAPARSFRKALLTLAQERPGTAVRVLDVATGAGDTPIRLAQWARRTGVALHLAGCDRSRVAVDYARSRAAEAGVTVTFAVRDVLADGLPGGHDALTCSLFLHHLAEAQAVWLLRNMSRATRRLVLVNDLSRGPLGYLAAEVGSRLLSRSEVVHADGPASVRAGFTPREARELAAAAGLSGASVRRCWPFRWLLTWRRP
jgi:2-polyprenyl-3-methyl-5-hydroxy-6-metoxy-1,4-benzoquinol methylase